MGDTNSGREMMGDMSFFERNIIALDTCVCRNLAYGNESWFDTFRTMGKEGFEFCIPDVCFFELVNQFLRGSIVADKWQTMFAKLKEILSCQFPVLPVGRQLFELIGEIRQDDLESLQKYYSEIFLQITAATSQEMLLNQRISFCAEGEKYQCKSYYNRIEVEFQKERKSWVDRVKLGKGDSDETIRRLDEEFPAVPRVSHRLDLFIKIVAQSSERFAAGKYNPEAKKKRNDGIDILALMALAAPARFCTLDRMNGIGDADSYQRAWVMTPDEIAMNFKSNLLPKLNW